MGITWVIYKEHLEQCLLQNKGYIWAVIIRIGFYSKNEKFI